MVECIDEGDLGLLAVAVLGRGMSEEGTSSRRESKKMGKSALGF
jgi:hypothetical protein